MTYEDVKKQVEDIIKRNKHYMHVYLNTLDIEFITDELIIMCIDAGIHNMLPYIKNQTEEICIKAVTNYASDLLCVEKQTHDICMAAAQSSMCNDGYLLGAVHNQTDDICMAFIEKDPSAIAYMRNQTKEACEFAVRKNSNVLKYIRIQDEFICSMAIHKYPFVIRYTRNITDKLKKIVSQNSYLRRTK